MSKEGKISNIFIDEAHMVESWGGDFRVDFQLLPSKIRGWFENSNKSIKTVLMSATLSDTTINILKELFSYTKNIKNLYFLG